MERLKELLKEIWEEYEGAMHYSHMAARVKDSDPSASASYMEMAKQELSHAQSLYDMAERCVHHHASDPDGHDWQLIWTWEKDKLMEKKAKVHAMLH